MARNKVFNVHDLYPADYCFDYESFYADSEGYVFTPDDMDAMSLAIKNTSVNSFDVSIIAARITGYGIDTPPNPGPPLTVYNEAFLPH